MKKNIRSILKKVFPAAAFLVGCMIYSGSALAEPINLELFYDGESHSYSAEPVSIKINGAELYGLDMPPIILNDRTLIPARAVFEQVGAQVVWNGETREVYIAKESEVVVLKIDSTTGLKNGVEFSMDVAPKIINDRTLIPVRFASEAMGLTVDWNPESRVVSIEEPKPVETEPVSDPTLTGDTEAGINITGIGVPKSASDNQDFVIRAGGVISEYNSFMLGSDRLVVDIYDANMKILNSEIKVENSPYVNSVRSGQNQVTPRKIARVVFDLKAAGDYTVSLSNDKKSLNVSFTVNRLASLTTRASGKDDIIVLDSDASLNITGYVDFAPLSIVLDIPGVQSQLASDYNIDGNLVDSVSVEKTGDSDIRMRLMLSALAEFDISSSGKVTEIT
ncbi:MAG: AMIN domain-containing protein, partial [Firmicutes bacterium]|nr:AMIN domain-containing protein [Bacillota bacterium]